MTTSKSRMRILVFLLAAVLFLGILPVTAGASTIADGSATCTVNPIGKHRYLYTTAGTILGASYYQYTTNDGLTGTAYCVDHGLMYSSHPLEIRGVYTSSPATAGAFANGYPQHSLETFLGRFPGETVLAGLTEDEYSYATQFAVWATLGQLAIEGTAYTQGRETIAQPTGDLQQMRVFRAIQLILATAATWDRVYQTGMYIRLEPDALGGNLSLPANMTLEYAAETARYGIRREVIGGVAYYTREYTVASATSTYYSGYNIELWAEGAPAGTIFTNTENQELPRGSFRDTPTWTLPVREAGTTLNENGFEYAGVAKLCIPVETVPNSGEITLHSAAYVMQYNIYLAYNESRYEQSYMISDPSKGTVTANAALSWGSELTETGSLRVTKVSGSGQPLAGAKFTLSGSDGSTRTGVTDASGVILWELLSPEYSYTLTETEAPAGYALVDPVNVQIKAARVNDVTVQDGTQKQLTVRKIDQQNGYSLAGAVIAFEQIDGGFFTTRTTDHAGLIQLDADSLPLGSYKVYEQASPEGYELDATVHTVNWDGRQDVTLTFTNVRKPTLILYKCDENNTSSLSGATLAVYRNGQLFTTVTTDDNGLAYVSGVSTGYYIVKETVAPTGYLLDETEYSVYVDVYDPATTDDPRLVIRNRIKPSLRIVKYDAGTGRPLAGTVFEVFRDARSIGRYTTDAGGEIYLHDLTPGTYLVREVEASPGYTVNSSPQEIELSGNESRTLVFLNELKPGLRLVKLDRETLLPLAGAIFRVTQEGGAFSREYVTDNSGEILLTGLEPGTYTVTEETAPAGYLMDEARRTVTVRAGESAQLVFTDTRKPSLSIVKYDANMERRLAGATFRISRIGDEGSYLDRITDADGSIVLRDLEPGVYSVREIAAPAGYILNDTEYHVQLYPGKTAQLVACNDGKPGLRIVKTDAITGEPVRGVTFTVKKADGATLTTEATGADGTVSLENLDTGIYEVWEQSVPDDYLLNDAHQFITLEPNRTGTLRFQDYPRPSLTIRKVDSITGDPLKGVRFRIYYASGSTATGEINDLGNFYTDESGIVRITDIRDGWYKVVEEETIAGYAREEAPQEFFVEAGRSKTVTFENTPLSALVVFKYDRETGEAVEGAVFALRCVSGSSGTGGTVIGTYRTSANGSFTVTGLKAGAYVVEELASDSGHVIDAAPQTAYLSGESRDVVQLYFGNTPKGSILIRKIDSVTHAPLSGVRFFITDSSGAVLGSGGGYFTTDSYGSIRIDDLAPGLTVIAKETEAKDGYVLDDTPQVIQVKAGKTVELEFRNAPKGGLVIQKVDSLSREPLAGAVYQVLHADGSYADNYGGSVSSNGRYTTGADGLIRLYDLVPDTYVVTEAKAPEGYALNSQPQTVRVQAGDTQTLVFENPPTGGLLIRKLDTATHAPISDVQFSVTDGSGAAIGNGYYTTDSAGTIRIDGIAPGTMLVVKETRARNGYVLDDTPQIVTVQAGKLAELEFRNAPKGGLVIQKVDSITGESLSGAVFRVTTSGGGYVDNSGGYVSSNGLYTTDRQGLIRLYDLEPGTYVVTEVQSPDTHILGGTPQTVRVNAADVQTLTFANAPKGSLLIRKLDASTHAPLSDVRFSVTDDTGAVIGSGYYTTDSAGTILIEGLTPGTTLVVRETQARAGYLLDDTPQIVRIVSGKTQELEFRNAPKGGLLIRKIDSVTKEPLAGAVFQVLHADGSYADNYGGYVSANGLYMTDSLGQIRLYDLAPDTYTVTEVRSPDTHILDATPQTIRVNAEDVQTLTFANTPKGGLLIRKIDAATHEPLSDVQFYVTDSSGAVIGPNGGYYTTDSTGTIHIDGLAPGTTLIVKESRAKSGYILDDTAQTAVIRDGETVTLEFRNVPKGALVILKLDSVTGLPLAGAWFKVTMATGELVASNEGQTSSNGLYVTDEYGQIVLSKLEPDTYIVTEDRAPDYYKPDSMAQTVLVSGADTQVLRFYDEPLCTLTVYKRDSETKRPLAGAEFTATYSDGAMIGHYTSDKDGKLVISGLMPDATVIVTEDKAPAGYVRESTPKTILVRSGAVNSLTFDNEPTTTLIIHKYVTGTENEPLSGVCFRVTDGSGAAVGPDDGIYYTDMAGEIVLTGLTPGKVVTAREIRTVDGFVLDGTPQDIEIVAGTVQNLTFWNARQGTLIIRKLDSVTKAPISGAEFSLRYADGRYVDNADGHISSAGIYQTNARGEIVISGLTGTVVVTEEKTAAGYVLDPDSRTQTVTVNPDDTQTLTFYNTPKQTVIIQKYADGTGKPLAGVTFLVTDASSAPVGSANGEHMTDENGRILLTGLTPGTVLTVKEVRTVKGYVLNEIPQTITVGQAATQTVNVGGAAGGNTLTFYDVPTTTLIIHKYVTGTENEPLSGVCFRVTDGSGAAVGPDDGIYYTDMAGEIVLTGLTPGEVVTAREIRTVDGFVLDGTPQDIEIVAGTVQNLSFWNARQGALIIRKLDSVTGAPISGAEFSLRYADGRYVDNANGHISSAGIYQTNARGEIVITGLTGAIVVTEEKAAAGYVLDPDSRTQTVNVNPDDTQTLTFYNTPLGGIVITKSDEETGARLSGVQFEVRKLNGEIVGTFTTDRNGVIQLPGLASGWYAVTELKTQSGYALDTIPQPVEVKNGQMTTLALTNRRTSNILIHKVDADTGKGIYGAVFVLYDAGHNPIREYVSDQNGYVYMDDGLADGRYYLREIQAAEGYLPDDQLKTIYVQYGSTTEITWKNTAVRGQIQIVKKSADDNPMNGLPAGSLLEGAVFEIYDRAGNVVDTVRTDRNGRAASKLLPLARYTLREVTAPKGYSVNPTVLTAYLEYAGQIVSFAVEDTSVATGVSIRKTGYAEVMPGQPIRYTVTGIANTSTVGLESFYWRDTLPGQITLTRLVTGTYNQTLAYKVVYKTNLTGDSYRTLADNLSTAKNYVLDASPATLGLAANERVTEIMYVFGAVRAGFGEVETAYLSGTVNGGLSDGSSIVNVADVGGLYDGMWVQAVSRWNTAVYVKSTVTMPRTGY